MSIRGATYYLVKSKRGLEIWPARAKDIERLLKRKPGFELVCDGFKTLDEAKWKRRLLDALSQLDQSANA